MAICISNDLITREISLFIVNNLTFKGKNDYFGSEGSVEVVSCYTTVTIKGCKLILLPLFFGLFVASKYNLPVLPYSRYISDSQVRWPRREISFKGELRDFQVPLVKSTIDNLVNFRASLLAAHPGAGKTIMSCYVASHFRLVTLTVICFRFQYEQFVSSYSKFTNAKVCRVDEGVDEKIDYDVYLCMISSLHKLPDSVKSKIGLLIVDEFHLQYTQIRVSNLLTLDTYYMLGLTATPDANSGLSQIHKAFLGQKRVVKKFERPFNVYCINTLIEPTYEVGFNGKLKWSVYMQSLLYNKERNDFIIYTAITNPSKKVLILTSEKTHVEYLKHRLMGEGVKVSTFYGTDKSYEDNDIIIGTVSKMGTAFDEESFCKTFIKSRLDLLIMCNSYKNPTTIEQTCGRILRANQPNIVYLKDNGGPSNNHWKSFKKWSKTMDVKLVEKTVDLRLNHLDHHRIVSFLNLEKRGVVYSNDVIIYGS